MVVNVALRSFDRLRTLRNNTWVGLLLPLVAVALAGFFRYRFSSILDGFPFLTFVVAVAVCAFFSGARSGAIAALGGAFLTLYFAAPASPSSARAILATEAGVILYLAVCAVLVLITAVTQRAADRAADSSRELTELNEQLEQRVARRTRELEDANRQLSAEISSRSETEAQVRQLQKTEAIGQLTGGIAHDFNNMLAIITGSLDLALRHVPTEYEKARRHLIQALEGSQRAAQLTARLLAFSRQQALDPKPLDANKLVSGMSDLLRRTLGESTRLETVLGGGLWTMHADALQVENAIINLCVNSRDAMPEGGRLTLETSNASLDDRYAAENHVQPGQYVLIAVTDTGHGMTADVMQRAFDPFFTTKTVGRGSGLGLSQVYGFVKQSGGHVKAYSEPGQGTTVRIYFPRFLGQPDPACAPVLQPYARKRGATEEIILVVEDDAAVRATLVAGLLELGYSVIEAGDPEQALDIARDRQDIRLLLTDIVMPGMNGRQLADKMCALHPGLAVLYTTGYSRNAVIHNGILDPGIALLQKPFSLDDLAGKVRSVLDAVRGI